VYTEFGSSSINFSVRYWIPFKRQLDYNNAISDGVMALKKSYDANGITIPFPIRTLDFGIKGGEKLSAHLKQVQSPS
jgi:small-conductance mechanosensitive channel